MSKRKTASDYGDWYEEGYAKGQDVAEYIDDPDQAPDPLSGEMAGESIPEIFGSWEAATEDAMDGYETGYWDAISGNPPQAAYGKRKTATNSKVASEFKCAGCSRNAAYFCYQEGARASGFFACPDHVDNFADGRIVEPIAGPVAKRATRKTAADIATDGACGLSWDDSISTGITPAPSGRCPFEYFHEYDDSGEPIELEPEDIPDDFEVQPIGKTAKRATRKTGSAWVALDPTTGTEVANFASQDEGYDWYSELTANPWPEYESATWAAVDPVRGIAVSPLFYSPREVEDWMNEISIEPRQASRRSATRRRALASPLGSDHSSAGHRVEAMEDLTGVRYAYCFDCSRKLQDDPATNLLGVPKGAGKIAKRRSYIVVDAKQRPVSAAYRDENDAIAEMYRLSGVDDAGLSVKAKDVDIPTRVAQFSDRTVIEKGDRVFVNGPKDVGFGVILKANDPNRTGDSTTWFIRMDSGELANAHERYLSVKAKDVDIPKQPKRASIDSSGRGTDAAFRQFLRNAIRGTSVSMRKVDDDRYEISFPQGQEYLVEHMSQKLFERGFPNMRVAQFSDRTVIEVKI